MNKLIPFAKFNLFKAPVLDGAYVVSDANKTPKGFLFGTDTFISFLTKIDESFEKISSDQKKTFNNPAGKLIDLIEEHLPLNENFVQEMKESMAKSDYQMGISLEQISKTLHV